MILIDNVLIETPLIEECFVCDIEACKGACCWEGDFGAPVEADEMEIIDQILPLVRPLLSEEANRYLDENPAYTYYDGMKEYGTPLAADKSCIYLHKEDGVARCAFEMLQEEGKIAFRKPISCHLYPVRVDQNKQSGFSLMRYDIWSICAAACTKGKKSNTKVYQFAKDAIIRKFGQEFYERLEQIAERK